MSSDLFQLLPLILVAVTGLGVLLTELLPERARSAVPLAWLTAVGLSAGLYVVCSLWAGDAVSPVGAFLSGWVTIDGFTLFVWGTLLVSTMLVALYSHGIEAEQNLVKGEYYGFLSLALVGMMMLVAAANLLVLFLALETLSVSLYALVGMKRGSSRSAEAALKFFLNGGLASALLLYGLVLLWGETGTLELAGLGAVLAGGSGSPLLYLGGTLVLVGFGFKVGVVPFHMWLPDVHEGAPTTVVGLVSGAVAVAVFAALLRLVYQGMLPEVFAGMPFSYADAVVFVAVLTMTVGNLMAMHQQDVKRMLAYAGIAHVGYLLMGLLLVPPLGSGNPGLRFASGSVLFYLVAQGLAMLLAFGVLARLPTGGNDEGGLVRLAGLSRRRPGLAFLLGLALVSLAGFPPTAGFFARFALLRELTVLGNGKLVVLVGIAVANGLLSAYYYLRPVMHMYMQDGAGEGKELSSRTANFALVVLAALILVLGLLPGRLANLAKTASRELTYKHAPNLRSSGPARLAPFANQGAKDR